VEKIPKMECFFPNMQKYASVKGKLFPGRNICSKSEIKCSSDVKNTPVCTNLKAVVQHLGLGFKSRSGLEIKFSPS
jgi:hypothetical protein